MGAGYLVGLTRYGNFHRGRLAARSVLPHFQPSPDKAHGDRWPLTPRSIFMVKRRCAWVGESNPLMLEYHDREWGVPVHDDGKHFEFLVLEGAQAGLNWSIILNKREGYRRAFSEFDPSKVARYTEKRIQKLLLDPGIIRNRQKIEAAVRNARAVLAIQEEFGTFDAYAWRFVGGQPKVNRWRTVKQIPATSTESDAFSKDLKQRGFGFVGSTIIYAHMQAVGMVNDHLVGCFRYREVATS